MALETALLNTVPCVFASPPLPSRPSCARFAISMVPGLALAMCCLERAKETPD